MDCERFESVMMDELYGELDELTSAAAKRHIAGCARCAALMGGFRATRRVGTLPAVELPEGLERRVLRAAEAARQPAPFTRRLAHVISLAGSWAMRPQTAMAALSLVMIGTSVLLLRGKSSRAPASAEITVTEEGTPAPAAPSVAAAATEPSFPSYPSPAGSRGQEKDRLAVGAGGAGPAATPPVQAATEMADGDNRQRAASRPAAAKAASGLGSSANSQAEKAMTQNAAGRLAPPPGGGPAAMPKRSFAQAPAADAERSAPASPAEVDPGAALSAARGTRDSAIAEGRACASGPQFDAVARRASGTPVGWDALYEGALCYESAGDMTTARARLSSLLGVNAYRERARTELERIRPPQGAHGNGGRAAPEPPAAAPASPAPNSESF